MNREEINNLLNLYSNCGRVEILLNNGEVMFLDLNVHNFFKLYGLEPFYERKTRIAIEKYFEKLESKDQNFVFKKTTEIRKIDGFDYNKLVMVVYDDSKTSDAYAELVFINKLSEPVVLQVFAARTASNYLSNYTVCNVGNITAEVDANKLFTNKEYAYPIAISGNRGSCRLTHEQKLGKEKYLKSIAIEYNGNLTKEKPNMLNSGRGIAKVLSK